MFRFAGNGDEEVVTGGCVRDVVVLGAIEEVTDLRVLLGFLGQWMIMLVSRSHHNPRGIELVLYHPGVVEKV